MAKDLKADELPEGRSVQAFKSPPWVGGELEAAGGSLYGRIANGLIKGAAESSNRRTAADLKSTELIRDKPGQNPAGQNHKKHQDSRDPGSRAALA